MFDITDIADCGGHLLQRVAIFLNSVKYLLSWKHRLINDRYRSEFLLENFPSTFAFV
jgi:hypothetical protein